MKRIIAIILGMVLFNVCCLGRKIEDVPNVHVSDRSRFVSNADGVLSQQAESELNSALSSIWEGTSAEVVVVAVDNLDGMDVNDYATELFEKWGIGKSDNDNGLLILISKDDRRVSLRTGYGLEGALPDVVCGRIIRDEMAPHFREGDYDGGVAAAVSEVAAVLGRPDITDEIRSKYANDSGNARQKDDDNDWSFLWKMVIIAFLISFAIYLYAVVSTRKDPPTLRYNNIQKIRIVILVFTIFGLGTPFLFYYLLGRKMKAVRNGRRACPNCGEQMQKMDEVSDNAYLTPAQDTEEQLNSVDYDVWVCPNCNETDIIPFDNPNSPYTVCPNCGSKACSIIEDRTVTHPTTTSPGRGVRIYSCKNCGNRHNKYYEIAKKVSVPPIIILPGGGGGFGGGGFGGGSFGGGHTGGGGASGGW